MRTDEEIKSDILAELKWDPRIESSDIGITVKEGAVGLHGVVESYAERLAAEKAAKRVKGVRTIAEEIEVKYPSDKSVSDEDIAERIAKQYKWHYALGNNDIKAVVRNGFVTLTGEVDWNYQRDSARDLVAGSQGVTGVSNQITLRRHASAGDVTKKIKQALHRNANLEASHINVEVDDSGKVTLTGDVHTLYERNLVEDAVWGAPGITRVQDNLRIS